MQVSTLNLHNILKSTTISRETSTPTSTAIDKYTKHNNITCFIFGNEHDSVGFKHCEQLLNILYAKSHPAHPLLSSTKPIFSTDSKELSNNNNLFYNNNNEFMDDERRTMAGANCKRYLQTKSSERKRRRTNANLSDASERDETAEAPESPPTPQLRQTRQTSQRHQITASLIKIDKSELQTRCTTTGSCRKLLRSSKPDPNQDDEQPIIHGDEPKKQIDQNELGSSLRDHNRMESSQQNEEKEIYSKTCLENGNNFLTHGKLDINKEEEEVEDDNENEDDEEEEEDADIEEPPTEEGEPDDEEDEVTEDDKHLGEDNENKNSFANTHSCGSSNSRPQIIENQTLSSYPTGLPKYETTQSEHSESNDLVVEKIDIINELKLDSDTKINISKEQTEFKHSNSNEISHNPDDEEAEDEANRSDDPEAKGVAEIVKEANNEETQSRILLTSPVETLTTRVKTSDYNKLDANNEEEGDGDGEEEYDGNELSSNSSSLSSDTSTTSSFKTTSEDNEDFPNRCKLRLKINNNNKTRQKPPQQQVFEPTTNDVQTNANPSILNTQHSPSTNFVDSSRPPQSEQQEQYQLYNTVENNGCAKKSPKYSTTSPPLSLPPANISSPTSTVTEQTKISTPEQVITTELNTDFHCAINDNRESPTGEDGAQETYATSTQSHIFLKESPANNPISSMNMCDITHTNDFIENNLKIPDRLDCKIESELKHTHSNRDENEEKDGKIEEEKLKMSNESHEEQDFDKYLESSQAQHSNFDIERSDASHQQHEKDIIDAADKVYTQIEQQQQQQQQQQYHHHVTTSYDHMLNTHHRNQLQHHDQERHDAERQQQEHLALIQSQQHSMQQHYASEQLYQLQQQQQQEQQLHLQQQLILQQQQQDQQQHRNLPQNQATEQRQQQHSHMMDFLHPQHHPTANIHSPLHQQQQQQIHEVYHDLMMDEFHDDQNTPYKLGLSPSTVKHENQDDGYETSAGDVLTPNSHASSTHSATPQHHVQHPTAGLLPNVVKCEEQQAQHLQLQQHINSHSMSKNQTNDTSSNIGSRDPYHFIDDDLNAGSNNSLRNILTPPHSHARGNNQEAGPSNCMVMQADDCAANLTANNELFGLANPAAGGHHTQQQHQTCADLNSSAEINEHQQHRFSATGSADISGIDHGHSMLNLQTKPPQKRRGRKKKIPEGLSSTLEGSNPADVNTSDASVLGKTKERKKHDRFNGMPEEEVVKRTLPDHLCDNLDIVIIGINPGLFAAYKGHHYAGPGNHFWKCLYLSGLTQEQMSADEDFKLIKYGIGFTNMVQRATKGSADLTRKEIKEGSRLLLEKLQRYRPKIAVFNGKLIFEVFSGKKDFNFGRQPECVEGTDTFIWVMPSSSARCAQLPRAADKVPFYAALKKFRDYLKGLIPHIDEAECVFTEERIKQQCEQETYKNQQNVTNSSGSYVNGVGISNIDSPLQNSSGYPFDAETNPHGAAGGPGPPVSRSSDRFMMSSLVVGQHEKKKRGRPKKIKGQDIIDPVTGNKIQVTNNMQAHGGAGGDYAHILNLSMVQGGNNEMPKKKRGRPKKVKPQTTQLDMLHQDTQSSMMQQKPNIMSIQSMTGDITQGSPQRQVLQSKHQQHVAALYSTPPHHRSIYSPMASPMVSPSLNCSYSTNTPPSQPQHDKLGISTNGMEAIKSSSTDLISTHHQHNQIPDQNLGESPPPSSPNICAVDFEPPTAASTAPSANVNERVDTELNVMHQRLQNTHQRSRYNSPINPEVTTDHNTTEHFQQWLSPQHNHTHSPASATTAVFSNSPQQQPPSLHYHEQQQMQTLQQQQPQQELHAQWPLRHQGRYEEAANSPYMLNSSQLHHPHHHQQHQCNQLSSGDVARKSLSGLESLVDQIPTISESESVALSSAAAVNAQAAAAAAVESRLQGMHNTLGDSQLTPDTHFVNPATTPNPLTASNSPISSVTNSTNHQQQSGSSSTNLLNSNFSVSNLAASSASSNSSNNHESYGLTPNARPPTNTNAAYHHSNLMAAAVIAAAAVNSPTNLSASTAASATAAHHAQMYMDPHAHLTTHVPVNSIYPPTSHHPATAAHHAAAAHHHHHHAAAAAAHYGSAQHTAADYASNPYAAAAAAAAQSNVNAAHTLHMPSPNYPYGYASASSQSNYAGYPHSHGSHHGHPHAHHTAHHHLAMFDRLKPSDIGGYSGF